MRGFEFYGERENGTKCFPFPHPMGNHVFLKKV